MTMQLHLSQNQIKSICSTYIIMLSLGKKTTASVLLNFSIKMTFELDFSSWRSFCAVVLIDYGLVNMRGFMLKRNEKKEPLIHLWYRPHTSGDVHSRRAIYGIYDYTTCSYGQMILASNCIYTRRSWQSRRWWLIQHLLCYRFASRSMDSHANHATVD